MSCFQRKRRTAVAPPQGSGVDLVPRSGRAWRALKKTATSSCSWGCPSRCLGVYEVTAKIGEGGMGGLCQVDVARTSIASDETATQIFDLGTGHLTPNPEGTSAQEAMVDGSQQVAAGAKEILHESVHR